MSDVITLANKIAAEKENIRQAIETRGVDIPDTTPLSDYPAKIMAINTENSASDLYQRDPEFDTTATTFTMPGNYGTVADDGLAEYSNLEELDLNYVQTLAPYACADDTSLTTITANHLKYIGEDAFRNTGIVNFSNPHVQYVGANSFSNCANLQSATMSGLTHIPAGAFFNDQVLDTITFENVKTVGTEAFNNTVMLTNINLPKAETIATYAFQNVGNSANSTYGTKIQLSLPKAKNILPYAFYGSGAIESIDLPEVETIGTAAFSDGASKTISMPKVKVIEGSNLDGCSNSELYLPQCSYIGSSCFNSSANLTKLTVSEDGCVIMANSFYTTSGYPYNPVPDKIVGKVTRVGAGTFNCNDAGNWDIGKFTFDMDWTNLEYVGPLNTSGGTSAFYFYSYNGYSSGKNFLTIPGGALDFKNLKQCGYYYNGSSYYGIRGSVWSRSGSDHMHNVRKIWIPDACTYFIIDIRGKSGSDPIHIYTDKTAGIENWRFSSYASTDSRFTTGASDPYIIIHWGSTHEDFENGIYN